MDTPRRDAVVGVVGRRAARVDGRRRRLGLGNEEQREQLRRRHSGQRQGSPVTEPAGQLRRGGNDRHAGHRQPGTDQQPAEPVVRRRRRNGPTSRHPGRRVHRERAVQSAPEFRRDRDCRPALRALFGRRVRPNPTGHQVPLLPVANRCHRAPHLPLTGRVVHPGRTRDERFPRSRNRRVRDDERQLGPRVPPHRAAARP